MVSEILLEVLNLSIELLVQVCDFLVSEIGRLKLLFLDLAIKKFGHVSHICIGGDVLGVGVGWGGLLDVLWELRGRFCRLWKVGLMNVRLGLVRVRLGLVCVRLGLVRMVCFWLWRRFPGI